MRVDPPAPCAEALLAIARDALVDQLDSGDARHALRLLMASLQQALAARCSLQALAADGSVRWTEGEPGLEDAAPAAATTVAVERLGVRLGCLSVAGAGRDLGPALDPVLPAIAALLQQDAAPATTAAGAHLPLIDAALEGTDTWVWQWDLESDWLSDADRALERLGYAAGEVGRTQADWDRLIHPEDLAANRMAFEAHARGDTATYEHAYRLRAKDGRWRWLLERGRIVERHADGRPWRIVGTQTDITAQRETEQAASQATALLQSIARQVPGLLYRFELAPGRRGRLTYVSERGHELFGLTVGEVLEDIQVLWRAVDVDDQRRMLDALRRSAQSLGEWRCEFRVHRGDGQQRWMLGTAMPERRADGVVVWYGYAEDITGRRELEQARRDAAVADAANRAKTEFLSRMSHELRTPLNAVLGFAQLMEIDRAEPPASGQRRRLKLIRESGEHLLQMIGDMLDLTRIEVGGMTLAREPVALHELAAQALEMVRASAERAQLSLSLAAGGADLVVPADRTRLLQVLLNLLSNAVKYSRPGGRVELRLSRGADEQARIDVSDTGIGIAAAELPRIFEPFQRGGQAHGSVEGAGIGLAVTRALVLLMGGSVQVASTPGQGTTFSVRLPLADTAAAATGAT